MEDILLNYSSTTNPNLKSFISISSESHFPIQNLPYGVFVQSSNQQTHIGVAIGDYVLSLRVAEEEGLFEQTSFASKKIFAGDNLNSFMTLGRKVWMESRQIISKLLQKDNPIIKNNNELRQRSLFLMKDIKMVMPIQIGDYTDFYASKEHAKNIGTIIRGPKNALQPNWLHLPVGYHGRASSVVISGTNFHRPQGQIKPDGEANPIFSPSRAMDYELEMGFIVGVGNDLGNPISIDNVADHIFGLVLLNDWSARDIQTWEYVPLGPFNSKNFITSISPWVITMEALEPFRVSGPAQENPKPLPYLRASRDWAFNIQLEVQIKTKSMNLPHRLSTSNLKYLYWSMAQQLTHHSVTGCNMRTGDLLGTGTISGPASSEKSCLLELTWRGKNPVQLPNGELRKFLQDGDEVILSGWCQGDKYKIGFGEVRGTLLSPIDKI